MLVGQFPSQFCSTLARTAQSAVETDFVLAGVHLTIAHREKLPRSSNTPGRIVSQLAESQQFLVFLGVTGSDDR